MSGADWCSSGPRHKTCRERQWSFSDGQATRAKLYRLSHKCGSSVVLVRNVQRSLSLAIIGTRARLKLFPSLPAEDRCPQACRTVPETKRVSWRSATTRRVHVGRIGSALCAAWLTAEPFFAALMPPKPGRLTSTHCTGDRRMRL